MNNLCKISRQEMHLTAEMQLREKELNKSGRKSKRKENETIFSVITITFFSLEFIIITIIMI